MTYTLKALHRSAILLDLSNVLDMDIYVARVHEDLADHSYRELKALVAKLGGGNVTKQTKVGLRTLIANLVAARLPRI